MGTVILSSVFNDQSQVYALVLNFPYMVCGGLVFLYFLHAFLLYKGSKRRPARRRSSVALPSVMDERLRALVAEVELNVRENEQSITWERSYLRRLLAGEHRDIEAEDKAEALALRAEEREADAAEAAAETGFESVRGATRRALRRAGTWLGGTLFAIASRLLFGAGFSGGRLSTRLLCGIVMQLMISYNLAVFMCFQFAGIAEPYFGSDWDAEIEALFIIGSIVAAVLTFIVVFLQSLITLRNFRSHISRLRRGDYAFIPGGKKNTLDLSSTVGYMGFQVRSAARGRCVYTSALTRVPPRWPGTAAAFTPACFRVPPPRSATV